MLSDFSIFCVFHNKRKTGTKHVLVFRTDKSFLKTGTKQDLKVFLVSERALNSINLTGRGVDRGV